MPIIKPISGHTSTKGIQHYLLRDGRALAEDFINLPIASREFGDPDIAFNWGEEMDHTRRLAGNDKPHGDKRARTYKHYVISPSPDDNVSLDTLRELAISWAKEHFGSHEIAIVYHDDNDGHIPHAHVVVNNTNLDTGGRLRDEKPKALNRSLQRMASKRKLDYFSVEEGPTEGFAALAEKKSVAKAKPPTKQEVYIRRAETELKAKGQYSWVADIRSRVVVAKNLAKNESEFVDILVVLGIEVSDNSPKARRSDWLYSLSNQSTRRVSGEKLGLAFGKQALQARFNRRGLVRPDSISAKQCLALAKSAVVLDNLSELGQLANTLETNVRHRIKSIADYEPRIFSLRLKASGTADRVQRARLLKFVDELESASQFSQAKGLLPEVAPKSAKSGQKSGKRASIKPSAGRSKTKRPTAAPKVRHAPPPVRERSDLPREEGR